MTKPLPYGCIKRKQKPPTFYEFDKVPDSISHKNKIDLRVEIRNTSCLMKFILQHLKKIKI